MLRLEDRPKTFLVRGAAIAKALERSRANSMTALYTLKTIGSRSKSVSYSDPASGK